ncbi:unnamed protein product [Rotaria sp. Silwood1]|nr:unnamed protein product [Rotaria sp. Silwood1]
MLPIEGYQDAPLMPLEEAVKPINHLFDGDGLAGKIWTLKGRCKTPADGLSPDESASIMLYTVEWATAEKSLYYILNKTLRIEDRKMLRPWFPYLRLFIGALLRLPPIHGAVYRGVKNDISADYPLQTEQIWWGFSSCTDGVGVLESEQFCGTSGSRTMFHITCFDGRNIRNHSFYHSESEILLLPGRYLQVHSCYKADDGLRIIQLDEIKPPYELLKLPYNSPWRCIKPEIALPDNSPWRHIAPGISLLGTCTNPTCQAFQQEVIIPIGYRKFNVLADADSSSVKCPVCEKYVDITKLGFNECRWRINGIVQPQNLQAPIPFSENWSDTRGDSLKEFNLKEFIWRKLIVEAEP